MNPWFVSLGIILLLPVGLARMYFLAGCRAGWAVYLANVVWEIFPKKLGMERSILEAVAGVAGVVLLWLGGTPGIIVAGAGGILLGLEYTSRLREHRLLFVSPTGEMILTLEGPFVERLPQYRLGTLWTGRRFDLEVIISNPDPGPDAKPLTLHLEAPPSWLGDDGPGRVVEVPCSGGIRRVKWTLCPDVPRGADFLIIRTSADKTRELRLAYDGVVPQTELRIEHAAISRYPGGRSSAFCWRGDMDLYDTLTRQSIAGLEVTLGLASRYAFPQTLCLSTRLALDENAAREWAAHDGRDHGAAEIPHFIQWLREKVDLRHTCAYPFQSPKPYLMELGNHGHLHYDTTAAAAPENNWKSHARMGAGRYAWLGADASSFGEQRDNIQEAARWCARLLGFVPRSWAKPGRCNDGETARAAAAAGCEVLSGSDIRARDNVLFQSPPHHPGSTDAVELTSRYPPDPQHIHHVAMLEFWLQRSLRLGRPMVYMCHQHMRQWEGPACARFTEHLLRSVLVDFHGEFYIDTLFGIGKYWREVLSPKTRRVRVALTDSRLEVENSSDMDFANMPVDLELSGGRRTTLLVSVPRGQTVAIEWQER